MGLMIKLYKTKCIDYKTLGLSRGGVHETGPNDLIPWTSPTFWGLELGPMHETFCAKK